jgi:hypothetical protein
VDRRDRRSSHAGSQDDQKSRRGERNSRTLFSVLVIAAFAVVFIIAEIRDRALGDTSASEVEMRAQGTEEVSPEEISVPSRYKSYLRERIESALGTKHPLYGLRVRRVRFDENDIRRPIISVFVEERPTRTQTRSEMLRIGVLVFRVVFEDPRVRLASVHLLRPRVGLGGVRTLSEAMMFRMGAATASSIDWSDFPPSSLPSVVDFSSEASNWD